MVKITIVHGDKRHELEADAVDGAEVLKMQITSVTDIDSEKMVVTGLGVGALHDTADLVALGLKDGHVLTVREGTPQALPGAAAAAPTPPAGAGINVNALASALQQAQQKKTQEEVQREQGMAQMTSRIQGGCNHVLIYERPDVRAQAMQHIPAEELRKRARENPRNLGPRDAVARHLLAWFKHEHFKWVNNAPCDACGSKKTKNAGGTAPNAQEKAWMAGVVELYNCQDCGHTTRFPRINHPGKLMETRRGRCGEWANAFTLCCICMGFEARHVIDWTDHVWTEVYSEDQQRWIHCDACEDCWDRPLLYCEGWKKKLTYVVAFSKEEVVDVTCRYTRQWDLCRARRTLCPELWLQEFIYSVSMGRCASLPQPRQQILSARREQEAGELEPRNWVKPAGWEEGVALPGRTTGSWEWRAARGELGNGEGAAGKEGGEGGGGGGGLAARRSVAYGGSHEDTEAFDDVAWLGERGTRVKVRGVTVWAEAAGLVHGLQVHYLECDDDSCRPLEGPKHIKDEGVAPAPRRIAIDPESEVIAEVGGRAGALLDRLELKIASRSGGELLRTEAFGGTGGEAFRCEVPPGHEFVGFHGGTGGHVHRIGIYARPQAAQGAPCEDAGQGGKAKEGGACATTVLGAPEEALPSAEAQKLRLQRLIRHFFVELSRGGDGAKLEPNEAAALAVKKASEWVGANGASGPLPEGCA